jgi:EmrB/QacA subfamily drug resistance transporter
MLPAAGTAEREGGANLATETAAKQQTNPWLILVVLCLGFFMIMLDTTIVNIAVPAMLNGLHASLDQILWVLNGFLLAYAVLLITAGRLGDLWGPRPLFMVGLAIFTLASAACGAAQNADQMIAARVAQGVGGALLTPQTLTIITFIFPPERRGAAMGVWGSVVGLATVAGPTVGGFLVKYVDWRWIFYVNLPIGAVALIGTFLLVPDLRPGHRHRLDLVGVLLASIGLFLIVFGLVEGQRYDWGGFWGPLTIPEVLVAGTVVLIGFVLWELVPAEPLLPLSLFRNRNYSLMNWIQSNISFGMLGFFLPMVIVLQSVLGMDALKAGLTLAPLSVAAMFTAPFAGRMADRFGGKYILMVGLSLFALGMGVMISVISASATQVSFLLPTIIAGAGLGLCLAPLVAEAMREIRPQQAGAASGMLNTTRQVGGLIGTAVVGAVLQNRLATTLHDQAVDRATSLPAAVQGPFVDAFSHVARSGFQVAPGQNGGAQLPAGTPPQLVATLQQAAHDVFVNGFIGAVRPTLVVPIVVLAVGALSCLVVQGRKREVEQPAGTQEAASAMQD